MSQRRGTFTDQLNNIIQVIQLGRKTGVLTVERGEGLSLETGEITFVQGQVKHAQAGEYEGQVALNWLSTWRKCRFLFISSFERTTGALPAVTRDLRASNPPSNESNARMATVTPEGMDSRNGQAGSSSPCPRRIVQAEEALPFLEQMGLSRIHRHLFLLVDGHRTTSELVRLMGRSASEVQRLLRDLERIGVIEQ